MQVFIRTLNGARIAFEAEGSDTIRDLKLRIHDKEGIIPYVQRLIFTGRQLEDRRTLADYGIRNDSEIHLVYRLRAGGYLVQFVDLENKDALHRIAFTHGEGHSWSRVSSGLNMEGKCTRESCQAYGKRVLSIMQFGDFDITTLKFCCPRCDCSIEASTCGFTDCEWKYSGRKRGSSIEISSEWHLVGDEYERFREAGNMAFWAALVITARPNPSPRPQCEMCLRSMLWEEDHQSLDCGCRFHRACVTSWKLRESQCPACRVEMGAANMIAPSGDGGSRYLGFIGDPSGDGGSRYLGFIGDPSGDGGSRYLGGIGERRNPQQGPSNFIWAACAMPKSRDRFLSFLFLLSCVLFFLLVLVSNPSGVCHRTYSTARASVGGRLFQLPSSAPPPPSLWHEVFIRTSPSKVENS